MGLKKTRWHRNGPLDVEILRTGVLLSAHETRHRPGGADALPVGVPSDIGTANAEGVSTSFARLDHVHKHPTGLGETLHHSHFARILWENQLKSDDRTGVPPEAANTLYLTPIAIPFKLTIDMIGCVCDSLGASPHGNFRAGIYTDGSTPDTPQGGTLQVKSAATAITGIGKLAATVSDTQLNPGLYWIAIVFDGDANDNSYGFLYPWYVTSGIDPNPWIIGSGVGFDIPDPCPTGGYTSDEVASGFVRVKSIP